MKILLTGANGFVGSHIAEGLAAEGLSVRCLLRPTSDRRWLAGTHFEPCLGDMTDGTSLRNAVKGVDAVVHAAGIVRAVRRDDYYTVNQHATAELARAVLDCNPSLAKFIYISSQAAMGPSSGPVPKPLSSPEVPVSDYGKSKLAGERELRILREKVPCTILRPASVYGPRDKDIFIFFNLVHHGLRPVTLTRRLIQLVYVGDIVKAVKASLANPGTCEKTYYLAEDTGYTWKDVAGTIAGALGRPTIPVPVPDIAFHAASLAAESIARLRGRPAVLNRQKIDEMLQPYWLGDTKPARKELALDFTNLKIGAKITYLWYKNENWF